MFQVMGAKPGQHNGKSRNQIQCSEWSILRRSLTERQQRSHLINLFPKDDFILPMKIGVLLSSIRWNKTEKQSLSYNARLTCIRLLAYPWAENRFSPFDWITLDSPKYHRSKQWLSHLARYVTQCRKTIYGVSRRCMHVSAVHGAHLLAIPSNTTQTIRRYMGHRWKFLSYTCQLFEICAEKPRNMNNFVQPCGPLCKNIRHRKKICRRKNLFQSNNWKPWLATVFPEDGTKHEMDSMCQLFMI